MSPAAMKWTAALVLAALIAFVGYDYASQRAENKELRRGVRELTRGIKALDDRADRYDQTLAENQQFKAETDTQASRGIARNEQARRSDHETIAIDKPWPAAMRHRVFANPDPASGSTEAASAAGTGTGRREVPVAR